MKYTFLFFTLLFCSLSLSQVIDTTTVNYRGTQFYYIKCDTNTSVLTFLHGGVSNPIFNDTSKTLELKLLLEGNTSFVSSALKNGFDLVIPVTNDSMNWLTNHQYCHAILNSFIDSVKTYRTNYISGFSDGGSGSYKIFYDYSDCFDGLVVFNGYPQRKNFLKSVN